MELHLLSDLTTLLDCLAPVVVGLSTKWCFEGFGCLGSVMGLYHLALLRGATVIEEDLVV